MSRTDERNGLAGTHPDGGGRQRGQPASGFPKLVYVSRDTTTALPTDFSVDPRCLFGPPYDLDPSAQLTVRSAATGFTFTTWLPCGGWTVNGPGNTYKFKNTSGYFCQTVVIKDGKLTKAICKGPSLFYDLMSTDQVNVDVVLRANARFGGEPGGGARRSTAARLAATS